MSDPTWTFVTTTYNSSTQIEAYWAAGAPAGAEWIVVDNCSTDGTAELARDLGARVIGMHRNSGFGTANNVGLEAAKGKYVAFVNPDATVDTSTLLNLAESITTTSGFVAPQLRNPDGSLQMNGRGYPTLWNKVANRLPLAGTRRNGYTRAARAGERIPVCWVMGAAVAGTLEQWQRVGGWDEDFFLYYEDADQGMRAWRHGIPVHIDGSVSWTHGWARETSRPALGPWRRELRSMATFYRKYPWLIGPQALAARRYPYVGIT